MRRVLVALAILLGVTGAIVAWENPKPTGKPAAPADTTKSTGTEAQEAPIRKLVAEFEKAYNAHDAKALAGLFVSEAQVVDAENVTVQGRAEIEGVFAGIFEETPETKIEVVIESIRFIGSALAVETGTSTTIAAPGEPPERGGYMVVHAQRDGKWAMVLVRDMPAEPTHHDHLQSLAWLVGDWIDESRDGVVKTSCRWADNGSFLLQEVTVRQRNGEVIKISQRIGWDPLTKRFKAWMFDEHGSHGESYWTPTESGWLIKATSVRNDGSIASATNSIEPTSLDRYVFRSVDRIVGNEVLPPVEVQVVRQAPAPQ